MLNMKKVIPDYSKTVVKPSVKIYANQLVKTKCRNANVCLPFVLLYMLQWIQTVVEKAVYQRLQNTPEIN